MISFEKKKTDLPQPVAGETEPNRFERIRKLATEKHKKADSEPRRDLEVDRRRPDGLSLCRTLPASRQLPRIFKASATPLGGGWTPALRTGGSPPDALPATLGINQNARQTC